MYRPEGFASQFFQADLVQIRPKLVSLAMVILGFLSLEDVPKAFARVRQEGASKHDGGAREAPTESAALGEVAVQLLGISAEFCVTAGGRIKGGGLVLK